MEDAQMAARCVAKMAEYKAPPRTALDATQRIIDTAYGCQRIAASLKPPTTQTPEDRRKLITSTIALAAQALHLARWLESDQAQG